MAELVIQSIVVGSIYTLVALAFDIVFAGSRVINFAQGDIVAAGGVLLAVLTVAHGWPFGVAAIASACIVTAVSFAIVYVLVLPTLPGVLNRTVNEQAQLRWVLTTVGASVTMEAVGNLLMPSGTTAVSSPVSGSFGLLGARVPWYDVVVVVVAAALVLGTHVVMTTTQPGRRMRAVARDRYGAEVIGIKTRNFIVALFTVAGLLGALAGVLIAPITQADANSGFTLGLAGFAAATVGGLGDIRGAAIGGLCVGFAELFGARYVNSQLESVFPLLVLIVVLMVRPRGLLQSSFVERV